VADQIPGLRRGAARAAEAGVLTGRDAGDWLERLRIGPLLAGPTFYRVTARRSAAGE